MAVAREQGVARGRKLRVDTTVVESHIHYPTDSTLLGDGIRVLSRSLARIAAQCQRGTVDVVNHGRAVKHRLLEISRAAKSLTTRGPPGACGSPSVSGQAAGYTGSSKEGQSTFLPRHSHALIGPTKKSGFCNSL